MNQISKIETHDIGEAVRSAALLADVTISVWGAERTDQKLMDEVKAQHGATGNVGRTVKNMLAGADGLLKDTKSAFAAVRSRHYAMTLPWVSDPHAERQRGPRLLPNMLWDRYTTAIAQARTAAYATRDKFIGEYPELVERARVNLGTMADDHYPTADEVRAQFRIAVDFEPIPAGVAFKGLPDQVLDKLAASLQRKQERMIESATAAMWEEVRDRVARITERLSDPEARFKVTTVEGVRDLITLIPGWNVVGDTRASEIAHDIEAMLDGIRADDLRNDAIVRGNVANQARAVAEKLTSWGL